MKQPATDKGPRRTGGGPHRPHSQTKKPGGHANKASGKQRSAKNNIRGIERLLKKEDLDPKVRQRKERELEELRQVQEQHKRQERERKYAVMYHRVRFFERVKIERHIKQLEKKQAAGSLSDAEEQQLAKWREDLEYVLHFPKGEKFVSLLRNAEGEEGQKHLEAERERLRALVKKQLAEVAAVTEADEGRGLAQQGASKHNQKDSKGGANSSAAVLEDDFFLAADDEVEEQGNSSSQDSESEDEHGGAANVQKRPAATAPQKPAKQQPGKAPPVKKPQTQQLKQSAVALAGDSSDSDTDDASDDDEGMSSGDGAEVSGQDGGTGSPSQHSDDDDASTSGDDEDEDVAEGAHKGTHHKLQQQSRGNSSGGFAGKQGHGGKLSKVPQGQSGTAWQGGQGQRWNGTAQQLHRPGGKPQHDSSKQHNRQDDQWHGKPRDGTKQQHGSGGKFGGRPQQGGQQQQGAINIKPPSAKFANQSKKCGAKPEEDRKSQGLPLRTRAEGGRKRRKKN